MSAHDDSDISLAELERTWVSHELHDGLMQWIVGGKMQVEAMHAKSLDGQHPTTDQLQYLLTLMSKAVVEGRRLLAGLRPPDLDESDWHVALSHWAAIARAGNSARIDLNLDESTRAVRDALQRCAYRIIQESVGNALRHADATSVTVSATRNDGGILLEIADDGCGFDVADVAPDRYGLRGIRERSALLGGKATIESTSGQGTRISVSLPADPTP